MLHKGDRHGSFLVSEALYTKFKQKLRNILNHELSE